MQFFLSDSDTVPVQLFSAGNAPLGGYQAKRAPLLTQRRERSVPGYPYIRFASDNDYDGSYPFDAFQDLRSAYGASPLESIQAQMRELQQERAQHQLRGTLLARQLRAHEQRERELASLQHQLEQQRREHARQVSQQAREQYLGRLKKEEQQRQIAAQRKAQAEAQQRARAPPAKQPEAPQTFYPAFHFFDHILNNQLRSQDDVERKRAHKSALSDVLDLYFGDSEEKPSPEHRRDSVSPKRDAAAEELSEAADQEEEEGGQRSLPPSATRGPHMEPAVLDNVLRVVHDRLSEIAAEEESEKKEEGKSPSPDNNQVNVDVVEEPPSEVSESPALKAPRGSPFKQGSVQVEEPTDYNGLADTLRSRVDGLDDDNIFLPRSPLLDSDHSEAEEVDEAPREGSEKVGDMKAERPAMDTEQTAEPTGDRAGEDEHTDTEFANLLDNCKSQLRDLQESAKNEKPTRKHRKHRRRHNHSKRAKTDTPTTEKKVGGRRKADRGLEDFILGTKAKKAETSAEARQSMAVLKEIEDELDEVRRSYSRQLSDTQLSFVADKNGDLRLAYNQGNAPFHMYQETLQKLLFKLDEVPSYGDDCVRAKRRAIVCKIQAILNSLDQLAADQESELSGSSSSGALEAALADESSNAEYA
ncbi:hypothetical protein GGF46_004403 [Coemansia sp. RSA 552]|nr:hypothetical protein GGF46_004403 [Coemansia sp. RSA 552]